MPFLDVLVHEAQKRTLVSGTEWVEGEYDESEVLGPVFDCVVFLPQGTETSQGRGRRVREPTMLYDPEDVTGGIVELGADDEVLVVSPELNLAEGLAEGAQVRWMVTGAPQPFGKPGEDVIGFQATLRRVED